MTRNDPPSDEQIKADVLRQRDQDDIADHERETLAGARARDRREFDKAAVREIRQRLKETPRRVKR